MKGSCDFMSRKEPIKISRRPAKFGSHRHSGSEDVTF